jgi:hypothetical protein
VDIFLVREESPLTTKGSEPWITVNDNSNERKRKSQVQRNVGSGATFSASLSFGNGTLISSPLHRNFILLLLMTLPLLILFLDASLTLRYRTLREKIGH